MHSGALRERVAMRVFQYHVRPDQLSGDECRLATSAG